jgi:hypothetical protein
MLKKLAIFARYAAGLPGFLRRPFTADEAEQRIRGALAARETNFLNVLRRGVFENPRSPYLRLLQHASIPLQDIQRWVYQDGIEAAMGKLYDAGVYVTSDEFKGRRPIRRPGLELANSASDFDNPLLTRHYEAQTSGSRGIATRVPIDLDLLKQEAAYIHLFLTAFDLWDRPFGSWRAVPPVSSGMKLLLRNAKAGKKVERWFSQNQLDRTAGNLQFVIFTAFTIYASRLLGWPLPSPIYVPREKVWKLARWLAEKKQQGTPALFDTNASSGVRICAAARERGLDLSGTFFRFGGEPYTPAKARVIAAAGARAVCHYSMAEIGHIGIACASPAHPDDLDDVHVTLDKVAVLCRPKQFGTNIPSVNALIYTTVLPSCPKLMLNVESGDYGILERRECGCPLGRLGLGMHLRNIRSYEKLTSEGVTFLGTELMRLVEEVLPARFGGFPTDFQLVEEEEAGLPRVSILIDPRLGELNDAVVLSTVCQTLAECPGGGIMIDQWRQANTLRVVRRAPYATTSAKVLPLHIVRPV